MGENECKDFLSVANQFKLGALRTEQPHPLTVELSQMAQSNLQLAVSTLKKVDVYHDYHILKGWPHTMDAAKPVNNYTQHYMDKFFNKYLRD